MLRVSLSLFSLFFEEFAVSFGFPFFGSFLLDLDSGLEGDFELEFSFEYSRSWSLKIEAEIDESLTST